ncbi:MAG: F0F1 ATP synthase subunit A [Clostridiales bacterium]|nr:F0F1 ATP synthase subunit A [Clostridiales bacterium]
MALKVLTKPAADGISITGAQIYFSIPMPVMELIISEAQVTSCAVIISLTGLCLYLTHGISVIPSSKRQLAAEWIVEKVNALVEDNMGKRFMAYAPFVAAIMGLSAFSSLSSLLGLFPPTSDVNIIAGWAILVFVMITYYKLKAGVWNYVKGFFEPIPVFAPFNIIGEIATPVSMSFRHYGNVLSGVVISTLIASALQGLSSALLGWLPGFLGEIPYLRVGLPAILSMYFDVFSGCLQAFIFAMLTMLYISTAGPEEA